MKPYEMIFRLKFIIRKKIWKLNLKYIISEKRISVDLSDLPRIIIPDIIIDPVEREQLLQEAITCLKHEWNYFDLNFCREEHINWHRAPNSNIISPKIFSFDINFHDENQVGNCKNIWEKNRHHNLTILSLAYFVSDDEKYAEEVKTQILDWIKENPYLIGINWISPLEGAIRLISWVWCERLLKKSKHYETLFSPVSPIWASIHQHQKFIANTYSRGSSANNHLIGEMAGLFIAAIAFPCYSETSKWQKLSQTILEREIEKQTFPSGCNKEQAFSYQIFVIEFFLLAALESKNAHQSFSPSYLDILRKMIEVIPLMTDIGGNLPRYGDGDDGMAIQLQPQTSGKDNWIFQIASQFLEAQVPLPEKNMLAAQVLGFPKKGPAKKWHLEPSSIGWPDAGIFSLVSNRGASNELFVLADAGPHGYLSISAHGHADALSFTLSAKGIPFIVDPGTYAYLGDDYFRDYFRSSRAHNTIVIDGMQQSESLGPFLWGKKASSTVKEWKKHECGAKLVAFHDGYKKFGIIHQRTFDLKNQKLNIKDEIHGSGEHLIEIFIHLHPDCSVHKKEGNTLVVINKSRKLILGLPKVLGTKMEFGGRNFGWYSPRFGVKVPSPTIIGFVKTSLPAVLNVGMEVLHS